MVVGTGGRGAGGGVLGPPSFRLTLSQPGRHIMPTTLLRAPSDFQTPWQPYTYLKRKPNGRNWRGRERLWTVVAELYVAVEQHLQSIDLRARFAMVFCRPAYWWRRRYAGDGFCDYDGVHSGFYWIKNAENKFTQSDFTSFYRQVSK